MHDFEVRELVLNRNYDIFKIMEVLILHSKNAGACPAFIFFQEIGFPFHFFF